MRKYSLLLCTAAVLFVYSTAYAAEAMESENGFRAILSRQGEFIVDTNVVFFPDTNSQYNPSAAFDGTNYLVVWEDNRNGDWDIYGARVGSTGNVLDSIAIPISTASDVQSNPYVCYGDGDYLVVWEDTRNSIWDIYGARVTEDGVVLDPSGLPICSASNLQRLPAIAFDGDNYLVVWEDWRCGSYPPRYQIYGARVNQAGIVIDPGGIMISPYYEGGPAIVFDGEYYFVVWHRVIGHPPDWSRVEGIHVDTAGMTVGSTTYIPHQYFFGSYPALAFDGTDYFISMLGFTDSAWIYGARVTQSGWVLDTAGIVISSLQPQSGLFPSLAFDGTYYVTAWNDFLYPAPGDIYGARIGTSGVVMDTFAVSIQPGDQGPPALTSGIDGQVLIVYSGWTDSINYNPVNRMRIWGKFYPFVGLQEDSAYEVHDAYCHLMVKPNPFTNTTQIQCIVDNPQSLTDDTNLEICDASGRHLKDFPISPMMLRTTLSWDGFDNHGRRLPSGVYFVRFECGNSITTEKLLLIR